MKSFKITSTSWALAIFSMLIIILSGVLLSIKILPNNFGISFIAVISLIGVGLYLQRFISTAKIEIVLTKEFVTIRWLKQYFLHKKPDRKISFNEIKSYKYQEDQNFDLFQITFIDDTELNFWHFTFTKDDFKSLVHSFPEFVNCHNEIAETFKTNEARIHKPQKIERAKTIFENDASPFVVLLAISIILVISAIMIFKGNGISNPFLGLSGMAGAIFYLLQYLKYRKRKKEKE